MADTAALTEAEHGVYLLMLMYAWRTPDCCLPNDDLKIARMLRVTPGKWRKKYKPAMMQFCNEKDGNFYQKRLLKERKRVIKISETASKSANARWLKNKNLGDADAYADGDANGDAEPIHSIFNSRTIKKNSNSSKYDDVNKVDNVDKSDAPPGSLLKAATYEKARDAAPGYDIYFIEERWRSSGFAAKAKKPDVAFLGFVRKHVKENPL